MNLAARDVRKYAIASEPDGWQARTTMPSKRRSTSHQSKHAYLLRSRKLRGGLGGLRDYRHPLNSCKTSYSSMRGKGCLLKAYMNSVVGHFVRMLNPGATNDRPAALVLDAEDCASTRSLLQVAPGTHVFIAQRDKDVHQLMEKCIKRHVGTSQLAATTLIHDSYKKLDDLVQSGSVAVDQADFCESWNAASATMLNRLGSDVYADESIVRLTLSARWGCRTDDDNVEIVIREYCKEARNHGRVATILPIGCWWVDPEKTDDTTWRDQNRNSHCYAYHPRMINLVFLITKHGATLSAGAARIKAMAERRYSLRVAC